jgi:hypothetical protein
MPVLTGFTLSTRDRRLDCRQLSNFQTLDPSPQPSHPSRELVALNYRIGYHLVTDSSIHVIVHIRAAYTHSSHFEQYLSGAWYRPRQLFQPHVANAMQARHTHCARFFFLASPIFGTIAIHQTSYYVNHF